MMDGFESDVYHLSLKPYMYASKLTSHLCNMLFDCIHTNGDVSQVVLLCSSRHVGMKGSKDPVEWFGGLMPPEFTQCQQHFALGVSICKECVLIRRHVNNYICGYLSMDTTYFD